MKQLQVFCVVAEMLRGWGACSVHALLYPYRQTLTLPQPHSPCLQALWGALSCKPLPAHELWVSLEGAAGGPQGQRLRLEFRQLDTPRSAAEVLARLAPPSSANGSPVQGIVAGGGQDGGGGSGRGGAGPARPYGQQQQQLQQGQYGGPAPPKGRRTVAESDGGLLGGQGPRPPDIADLQRHLEGGIVLANTWTLVCGAFAPLMVPFSPCAGRYRPLVPCCLPSVQLPPKRLLSTTTCAANLPGRRGRHAGVVAGRPGTAVGRNVGAPRVCRVVRQGRGRHGRGPAGRGAKVRPLRPS